MSMPKQTFFVTCGRGFSELVSAELRETLQQIANICVVWPEESERALIEGKVWFALQTTCGCSCCKQFDCCSQQTGCCGVWSVVGERLCSLRLVERVMCAVCLCVHSSGVTKQELGGLLHEVCWDHVIGVWKTLGGKADTTPSGTFAFLSPAHKIAIRVLCKARGKHRPEQGVKRKLDHIATDGDVAWEADAEKHKAAGELSVFDVVTQALENALPFQQVTDYRTPLLDLSVAALTTSHPL